MFSLGNETSSFLSLGVLTWKIGLLITTANISPCEPYTRRSTLFISFKSPSTPPRQVLLSSFYLRKVKSREVGKLAKLLQVLSASISDPCLTPKPRVLATALGICPSAVCKVSFICGLYLSNFIKSLLDSHFCALY